MTRFSVLIVARESRSVLETVIRHYRRLGAERIMVFLDGAPEGFGDLDVPGLDLIACDDAFWRRHIGHDTAVIEEKQRAAHRIGLEGCPSDWLLIVDADEFLVSPRPVGEMLEDIPADVDALRIPNFEAVWGPGDVFGAEFGCTYFRKPVRHIWRPLLWLIYGRTSVLLRKGLAGHSSGKQFIRTGRRYDEIRIHTSLRDGVEIGRWLAEFLPREKAFIAHFDAVSFDRWTEKFRRRHSGESVAIKMRSYRTAQMELVRDAMGSDAERMRLCRSLNGLNRWQYMLLSAFGFAFRRSILIR